MRLRSYDGSEGSVLLRLSEAAWPMRRSALFQWFLTLLSERPTSRLAISDQALPSSLCASMKTSSSLALHSPLRTRGFRWLSQRSRHCLELRLRMDAAIVLHLMLLMGSATTSARSFSSSSFVHGPRLRSSSSVIEDGGEAEGGGEACCCRRRRARSCRAAVLGGKGGLDCEMDEIWSLFEGF